MYVTEVVSKGKNGKVYHSVLLRESYRVADKVCSRTLANLSSLSATAIVGIKNALQGKSDASLEDLVKNSESLKLVQAESFGAIWIVHQIAERIGICKALGPSQNAIFALSQIYSRLIRPGVSILATIRFLMTCAFCAICNVKEAFDEEDLYGNGKWLLRKQSCIERRLWKVSSHAKDNQLFLYDVTSSYLEGDKNDLGAFGYNRDKKVNKKQLVIGLLTDSTGDPCSIKVYKGNTRDFKTFFDQVRTVKKEFRCKGITFVGDRGMIQSEQIKDAQAAGFTFISAITKPQIKKLLRVGVFQLGLFDTEFAEVLNDGNRYILRRNPVRQKEMAEGRAKMKNFLVMRLQKSNEYLNGHSRAKPETQLKKAVKQIEKFKFKAWLSVKIEGRTLVLEEDLQALKEESKLDGCYVIRTDVKADQMTAKAVHDRYKDLAKVEEDFRVLKTAHMELRPWFVQREANTQAHAIVSMLGLKIRRYLDNAWKDLDLTVEEGLRELEKVCVMNLVENEGGKTVDRILAEPNPLQTKLLEALEIKLPKKVPEAKIEVGTRKKIKPTT